MAATTKDWGIFDDKLKPVFDYDTILSMKVESKANVSNFPVERGSFATYNKVRQPIKIEVKVSVGSLQYPASKGLSVNARKRKGVDRRSKLIADMGIARYSTDVYSIAMPEGTYPRMTLQDFSFARETNSGGPSRVIAEMSFVEVREVTAQYSNSKPRFSGGPAAGKKNAGKQQTVALVPDYLTKDPGDFFSKKFGLGRAGLPNAIPFFKAVKVDK